MLRETTVTTNLKAFHAIAANSDKHKAALEANVIGEKFNFPQWIFGVSYITDAR